MTRPDHDKMPSTKAEIGVVHGRFQPFHVEHLKYVLAAAFQCTHLIVGITSPDPHVAGEELADPVRGRPESNPFTFYERLCMVRDGLVAADRHPSTFDIVPFPISAPDLLRFYVPMDARFFLTIYDGWGIEKLRRLRSLNLDVVVLWQKTAGEKLLSGAQVRSAMRSGGDWQSLVPVGTREVLQRLDLSTRIGISHAAGAAETD